MNFAELQVLHIYQYNKASGQHCPLVQFIKEVSPLIVSTCMRHIYIFTAKQLENKEESLTNLLHHLKNPGEHQIKSTYDYLEGKEAYTFLLYWVLGGLNPKKPFNDVRILGSLREALYKAESGNSVSKKATWESNKLFAICLRKDSKNLIEWVQTLPENMTYPEKEQFIKAVCTRCTWAAEEGLLALFGNFDYSNLVSETEMFAHIHKLITIDEQRTTSERNKIRERTSPHQFLSLQSIKHIDERLTALRHYKEKYETMFQLAQISDLAI